MGQPVPANAPKIDALYASVQPEPNSGCWIWTGPLTVDGYGHVARKPTQATPHWGRRAHRIAYEQAKGPIPYGLSLDHLCRIRCCVNPDHLEPVTIAENNRRSNHAKPRQSHCLRGHPLSGENLDVGKHGKHYCRACRKLRNRNRGRKS